LATKTTELTPLISTAEASPNLTVPRTPDSSSEKNSRVPGHVVGGAGVKAPPVGFVVAGAIAEEDVCFWLIKVEESRCDRCRWR
jgi:hypothetical protein